MKRLALCVLMAGMVGCENQDAAIHRLKSYAEAHHLNWEVKQNPDGWYCATVWGSPLAGDAASGCSHWSVRWAVDDLLDDRLNPPQTQIIAHGEAK